MEPEHSPTASTVSLGELTTAALDRGWALSTHSRGDRLIVSASHRNRLLTVVWGFTPHGTFTATSAQLMTYSESGDGQLAGRVRRVPLAGLLDVIRQ